MSSGASSIFPQDKFKSYKHTPAGRYWFEDFYLDAEHLMLYHCDQPTDLAPKVVETLVGLVERAGEIVPKEELMQRLWGDTAVAESNLSQNLYVLRKILGKTASGLPFIETFRRRGYRFNAKVLEQQHQISFFPDPVASMPVLLRDDPRPLSAVERLETHAQGSSRRRWLLILFSVMISGAILTIGGGLYFRRIRDEARLMRPSLLPLTTARMTRLTPDLDIQSAAISPDGKYLSYDLNEKGKHSLWIKDILSGSGMRVRPPMNNAYYDLTFSPDGAYVYYNTPEKEHPNRTIFRIPSTGGQEAAIAYDTVSPITFSPDQQKIAFIRFHPPESSIVFTNSDGSGNEQILSSRNKTAGYEGWGSNLSWSPDGTRIAICGWRIIDGRFTHELIEVRIADGSERIIAAPGWDYLDDVGWLSDQSGLIVRARETNASPWQIWHVSYPSGETRRITNDLNYYDEISLSGDSRLLVVTKSVVDWNIWLTQFEDAGRARQITFGGTAADGAQGLAFTPDEKIIYTSPRDGNTDLWIMNTDGSDQRQLTKNAGESNSGPSVTRDGRFIVFLSSRAGKWEIWRMDADGGNPQQLTHSGAFAQSPFLTPDGAWIYFTSQDDERHIFAKTDINGSELITPKHATVSNLFTGPISPNGELMAVGFYDTAAKQPWKYGVMSLKSGELLERTYEGLRVVGGWTKDSKSLIVVRDADRSNLWLQPITGSEPRQLTNFENGQIRAFAISSDFRRIAVSRGNPSAEAVLISNFH